MAALTLRDRDGIASREGLIFRVFGYSHPPNAYICDAEYASEKIFKSTDPRAPRNAADGVFYKFYNDEGWKLIFKKYPKYTIHHAMLGRRVVGVNEADVAEVRKPEERLKTLAGETPKDELHDAVLRVLDAAVQGSGLKTTDFGVFGSMLHGFHHPKLSDIDLVVFGKEENRKIQETLAALYLDAGSGFRNEFETEEAMKGKRWRFKNYSVKEFVWHQKRKNVYGLFDDHKTGRTIKAEFEPVKKWGEIASEYNAAARILPKEWVRIRARVTASDEAPFIPSIYGIQPLEVLKGSKSALEATRVVSYMEEFRLQARKDETVLIEGNLEEIFSSKNSQRQIALTYCPRYYEQVLKVADSSA